MSSPDPELRDMIDSELRRIQIQNHVNFPAWHAALKPYARQVVDTILEEDVTPSLILYAQAAPDDETDEFDFLLVVGGGNPSPAVQAALTNYSLMDILISVENFHKPRE